MEIKELNKTHEIFKTTLKEDVDSLISLVKKDQGTKGRPGAWIDAVKRSSVVLLGASLENMIETAVCESFTFLAEQKLVARRYPERFRFWLFREEAHMRNIGIDDSKNFIHLTLKLYSDVRELSTSELKLNVLKDEFANPTPKNIDWIMGLLDFENYTDLLIKEISHNKIIN